MRAYVVALCLLVLPSASCQKSEPTYAEALELFNNEVERLRNLQARHEELIEHRKTVDRPSEDDNDEFLEMYKKNRADIDKQLERIVRAEQELDEAEKRR